MDCYAHSLPNRPQADWQKLEDHLENVAKLAAGFAGAFGAEEWGRLAGQWHDLGKYRPAFQRHLRGQARSGENTEHASTSGRHAAEYLSGPAALPFQFSLTCHHTGLQDFETVRLRLKNARELLREAWAHAPGSLREAPNLTLPARLLPALGSDRIAQQKCRRSLEFWIRMLHSSLVDADRLDAEECEIGNPDRGGFALMGELRKRLDSFVDAKVRDAAARGLSPVNSQRKVVLDACRAAAERPAGLFSLTVPTGGGKTLAAMSFALWHAERHGLQRVIVVIPYTSIIEQNAGVYAEALGEESVVQHHSNMDPEEETQRNRLACDNWDAPVIVTTNVQFFESLLSNRNSRLRKVHNIARSVVILDEAQCLPPGFLYPILEVMRELRSHYGCSLVLSTATQPALSRRETLREGLEGVTEIVPSSWSIRLNMRWARIPKANEQRRRLHNVLRSSVKALRTVCKLHTTTRHKPYYNSSTLFPRGATCWTCLETAPRTTSLPLPMEWRKLSCMNGIPSKPTGSSTARNWQKTEKAAKAFAWSRDPRAPPLPRPRN